MTNTPVTQIIEELDKRIAQITNAKESLPYWANSTEDKLETVLEELQNQRKYALTMLPVEAADKDKRIEELEKELAEAKEMVTIATKSPQEQKFQWMLDLDAYKKTHNINQ